MIKILLISIITVIYCGLTVLAQSPQESAPNEEYNSVVIMKNGAAYHFVKIIEIVEDEKIVIERMDHEVFHIPIKMIYGITDENTYSEMSKRCESDRLKLKDSLVGTINIGQIGFLVIDGTTYMSLSNIIGYRFKNGNSLGFGITFDGLVKAGYISAIFDSRWNTKYRKYNGFIYSQVGITTTMSNYEPDKGKLRIGFGGGITFTTRTGLSVSLQAGCRIHYHKDEDFKYGPEMMFGLIF